MMADRPGEADAAAVMEAVVYLASRSKAMDAQDAVDSATAALDRLTARLSEAERDLAQECEWHHRAELGWADERMRADAAEARLSEYEQALRFYANKSRYHSECCGNCIHNDGGAIARAALSGSTQTTHLHECRELNRKLKELISEAIDGEMGFRSTSDMRDFLLHGMENM